MKQDDVAGKILMELINLEIVDQKDEWTVYTYLQQAYAAGHDEALSQRSLMKKVAQYDLDGNLIDLYESQKKAAHVMQVNVATMRKALIGINKTCKGFIWKYVDVTKVTSSIEETVGSYRIPTKHPKR